MKDYQKGSHLQVKERFEPELLTLFGLLTSRTVKFFKVYSICYGSPSKYFQISKIPIEFFSFEWFT